MRIALRTICLLLLGLCITGCEETSLLTSNAKPEIWCVGEMAQITAATKQYKDYNTVGDDNIVKLFSALNETVAFQIVIDLPAGTKLSDLNISHTSLKTRQQEEIDSDNVKIFRMMPHAVKKYPAWYLRLTQSPAIATQFFDELVPLDAPKGGQPYKTTGRQRLCFWVDITVLPTDRTGTYRGVFDVRDGKTSLKKQTVELQVFEFILPLNKPIAIAGGFNHRNLLPLLMKHDNGQPFDPTWLDPSLPKVQQAIRIMREIFELAHEHKLDLFDTGLEPKMKRDHKGYLQLDWSVFDTIAGPYLTGKAFEDKIPVSAWPIPFSTIWPKPEYYGGMDSVAYALMTREFILQSARHFRSLGAAERFFAWPYRGRINQGGYSSYMMLANIVKNVDETIPLMSSLPLSPPRQTLLTAPKKFPKLVGISAVQGQWFAPAIMPQATPTNPLLGTWLIPGRPPYLPDIDIVSSPADIRALPWAVMKYRATGLLLPEVLDWKKGDTSNMLFYPGVKWGLKKALPSVRLKRLRRGMQDLGYLWILQQRKKNAMAQSIMDSMVRYAGMSTFEVDYFHPQLNGWVSRGYVWETTRRLLAEEVLDAVAVKRLTYQNKIAQQVRWKHFTDATQSLRPEQVTSKISYAPTTVNKVTGKVLRAKIDVEFYNEFQIPISCETTALVMPFGFKPVTPKATIRNFAPATRQQVQLEIAAANIPKTTNGKVPLDIRVSTSNKRQFTLLTEIPIIQSSRIHRKLSIDGKINDWPTMESNTAADFELLGKLGQIGTGRAKRQTIVHSLRDDENIYFAFRCFEPNLKGMTVRPTNTIQYSDLLGWGEDFIELLIAPGNNAQTTSDLYHIVVKPNGVVIQQKGVSSTPSLGAVTPIDLGAEVAIGHDKYGWIVEIKLPRKNFGSAGKEKLWGINFTRYATQGQEASSWSGAVNYFYNPKTLGAILLDNIAPNNENKP